MFDEFNFNETITRYIESWDGSKESAEIIGYTGKGYYFFTHDWKSLIGPFDTKKETNKAIDDYCREHLDLDIPENIVYNDDIKLGGW